ncbi:hypothetical protein DXC29_03225 [Bifidobacterium pseudocatenulatum]|nr:hypothetical protein DXC29_03225 [Bifidobacterium pseudocatenulatum]
MGRTSKFVLNAVSTALLQVVTMVAGFITPRFLLVAYGSDINGLISSINQFIVYFNLVEAGLSSAAVYSLYKPIAEHDYNQINRVVVAARNFYVKSGFIFVGLVFLLAFVYPWITHTEVLDKGTVFCLVLVLGVNGALEFFTLAKYRALLTADQKTYVISTASIVYTILNTLIVVVLSTLRVDILLLRIVALISIFARSLILYLYIKIHYKFIDYKVVPDNSAMDKRWSALYLQVVQTVQNASPAVLTTLFSTLKMVSVYSVYNMVLAGINGVMSVFSTGVSAGFGELLVKKDMKAFDKAYKDFEYLYYMAMSIVYGVTMATILPFIQVYTKGVNDVQYVNIVFAVLFVLNGVLYNLKTPQGMLVIAAGLYKETRIQSTIQASILVVGGVILGYSFGLTGVLVASCLSNFYRCVDLLFFIPKNVTHLPILPSLRRMVETLVVIILICAASWLCLPFRPNTLMTWVGYAFCNLVLAVLLVTLFHVLFERSNTHIVVDRVRLIFKRK